MKKIFQVFAILLLAFPALTFGECLEGDCMNGFGIYVFPEGGQYTGQFSDGEFAGMGMQIYADGNRYEGMFENGVIQGTGTLIYADGSIYKGEFKNGAISGRGTIVFASKSKYEGEFADGVFQGTGVYTYSDGSIYKGEFKNGLFDGKGTLYSDGQVYIGEFKEGKQYGKGTITYFDKSQETGEWKDGEFIVTKRTKAPRKNKKKAQEGTGAPFGFQDFSGETPSDSAPENVFFQENASPGENQNQFFVQENQSPEQEEFSPGEIFTEESETATQ